MTKPRGKVGEPLPVRFSLRSLWDAPVRILPSLDGSALGRFPRYYVLVFDENGEEQKPDKLGVCGFTNPLHPTDFITLQPGESCDPMGPGTFGHYMLRWLPTRPGTYTLEAIYDATGRVPDQWKGSVDKMDPQSLELLKGMPRGRYGAKRVTIVVD